MKLFIVSKIYDTSILSNNQIEKIIDADAYMVTGEGFEGFSLPIQFPKVPIICTYKMQQSEFIRAYMGSADVLGADKIKKAWLDIDEKKIVLRVNLK